MRGLLHILALDAALLVALAVGASAATVQVNGSTGTAEVTAPRPAEVRWNVGDVNKANGVFLFVSPSQGDLQTRATACAQGGDAALQNLGSAAGQPGTGFVKGDDGSKRVSLPRGTWYVLGCAVEEEDGQLSNLGGATNIVRVDVGDDRPSRGNVGTKADPQYEVFTVAPRPDLQIAAYHLKARRKQVKLWVYFDEDGPDLDLCRRADLIVYNAGGAASDRTDAMVTISHGRRSRSFRSSIPSILPGECVEVSVDLEDTKCDTGGVAAADASKRVAESDEGNNLSKPRPGGCPSKRKDHRGRRDHRTR